MERQIQEAEQATEESLRRIESLKQELWSLNEQRMALQEASECEGDGQIDAGEYLMGDDEGGRDGSPQRTVLMNAFQIDKSPVTNQEYNMFVDVAGHPRPPHWTSGTYQLDQADHPVTNISWPDAKAYCDWVEKRLPTESEWEKASRGTVGQTYPWGDAFRKDNVNRPTTMVERHRLTSYLAG